ncbi:MAG: hypothetical protein V4713_12195 [Pseudomonadota bacterium]
MKRESAIPNYVKYISDPEEAARQTTLGFAVRSSTSGLPLLLDSFCGGGGASLGMEMAFGRPVDIAINHDGEALAMHIANHPHTAHYQEDVFDVHPGFITGNRPIQLAWFSPDCKHHSIAKGGKPRDQKIRGLAWVALKWGALRKPRAIAIENVAEILTWGPLDAKGKPIKSEAGRTFQAFISALSTGLDPSHPDVPEIYEALGADFPMERLYAGLGYDVEYKVLRASAHGVPTIRKRLFIFARCDGQPVCWPEPTTGNPKAKDFQASGANPWRTAAECIDWSIKAPSIFTRKKPLVDATCRRVAKGIMRYVVETNEPFIVSLTHQGGDRIEPLPEPFKTITGAHRGEKALVTTSTAPFLTEHANSSTQRVFPADEPTRTQLAQVKGGHFSLVAPTLIQTGYGERPGQAPRVPGLEKPMGTAVTGQKHALVTASIVKHFTGAVGSEMTAPVPTVTAVDHNGILAATLVHYHADKRPEDVRASDLREPVKTQTTENRHALVAAHMTKFNTGSIGYPLDEPTHTVMAGGEQARPGTAITQGIVAANLIHMGHGEGADGTKRFSHGIRDVQQPLNTATAQGSPAGIVASSMLKLRGDNVGSATDSPVHAISAQGTHHAENRAFLLKYYGTDQDPQLAEPLHTVTTKDRFGVVTTRAVPLTLSEDQIDGARKVAEFMRSYGYDFGEFVIVTVNDEEYVIVDIGLRMLVPRELARAQGFPDTYILDPLVRKGRAVSRTKRSQGVKVNDRKWVVARLSKSAQVRMIGNSVCPPLACALIQANFANEIAMDRMAA